MSVHPRRPAGSGPSWQARVWHAGRRTLVTIVGLQFAFAIALTLVDSWRRRGKRARPFPRLAPITVPVGSGEVTTYTYGQDLYNDMLAAIDGAEESIALVSYIWKGDAVGVAFRDALARAVDRGVEVRAVYDGFANLVVRGFFDTFPPGVRLRRYPVWNPGWRFWDPRRYGRDHRKILVVDDRVGFLGGYNIGASYATEWRDTHLRLTGPGVWEVKRAFVDSWNQTVGRSDPMSLSPAGDWEPRIRLHRNVPRRWVFPIRGMYMEAINRAQSRVWMTHAYFTPDEDFIEVLEAAAGRGVDVRLLLPQTSNHVVADWISRGYFERLLRAGVRIFRFQGAMVHAKTATIDGRWSTVGTANIDRLSMTGNYEVNLEIIDDRVAAVLERIFETDLTNCVELSLAEWARRGPERRFTEAFLRPLRRLL